MKLRHKAWMKSATGPSVEIERVYQDQPCNELTYLGNFFTLAIECKVSVDEAAKAMELLKSAG